MAYDGPRFRRDLISTVFYEGGVRCVDVHDPKRGATFRLFDYEYSVALAFDGRDMGKVISWVHVTTGLVLTEEQLTGFAQRLDQLGFLEKPKAEGEVTPPPVVVETPAPLPIPSAPLPAPPRDETTPPPEAGSLATATRPTSGERMADTGAVPPLPLSAAEAPEPELDEARPPDEAVEPTPPPPLETAPPEEIAPVPQESAASPQEAPEPATAELPEQPEAPAETPPAAQEPEPPPKEEAAAPIPASSEDRKAEATTPAAPAAAPPPTSCEPELPLAVGPSPQKPRERPAQRSARLPADGNSARPASGRQVTPPPIPRTHLTPTPAPVTEARGRWIFSAFLGTLAALVLGAVLAPFALGTRPPPPVSVRVIKVNPAEIVRWLEATAPIETMPPQTLTFPVGGKVLRIASPGIELRPGDVVAATDAARSALDDWARAQEQLAFSRQLVEGLRDSEDKKKIASAEAAVTQKIQQQERALAALSKLAIIAKQSGTVEQTLVSLGQTVQAGGTAVRVRAPGWSARFDGQRVPAAQLRKQGLCLTEISGRRVTCDFVPEEREDTHLAIHLPADAVSSAGLLLHLARSRFQDATLVPAEALSDSNGKPRVLVVAPNNRIEMRSVVLADRTPVNAVVTQGLDPGDAVVIHADRPIGAGTPVHIEVTLGY